MPANDPKCTRCKNHPPKWQDKLYKMQQVCDGCWTWLFNEALKNRHSEWFLANYDGHLDKLPQHIRDAVGI